MKKESDLETKLEKLKLLEVFVTNE
jgi:hypothetical protein